LSKDFEEKFEKEFEENKPNENSENIVKKLLIGRWHPKIDPDLEKVFNVILDLLVYGIIFYLAIDVMMAGQYNEYQTRSYCYTFITAAQCKCMGQSPEILLNRSIAIPNPSLILQTQGEENVRIFLNNKTNLTK